MFAAVAFLGLTSGVCQAAPPKPAPAVFVTRNYGITFASPIGTTYCPLPAGWIGSDHGTIVFLVPPGKCGGAGYPSNGRGFRPSDVRRIEVYYGYALDDAELSPAPCDRIGTTRLFGVDHAICETRDRMTIRQTVRAGYLLDEKSEVSITLVTTAERLAQDCVPFQQLVTSVRACSSKSRVSVRKETKFGTGPACPEGTFY